MSEEKPSPAGQRDRSPAYPIIPLETALERLVAFEEHFKCSPAELGRAGAAWGIKSKAYGDRTAAALKYYGLLNYENGETGRQIVISEQGRKYLRAQQEHIRQKVKEEAALTPPQILKFWGLWGRDRPADEVCLDDLVLKNSFSDLGARKFLKIYDATITFAGLADSSEAAASNDEGVGAQEIQQQQSVSPSPISTLPPSELEKDSSGASDESKVNEGSRKAVFPIEDGDVTLIFPKNISSDSLEELGQYLNIFLKKEQKKKKPE